MWRWWVHMSQTARKEPLWLGKWNILMWTGTEGFDVGFTRRDDARVGYARNVKACLARNEESKLRKVLVILPFPRDTFEQKQHPHVRLSSFRSELGDGAIPFWSLCLSPLPGPTDCSLIAVLFDFLFPKLSCLFSCQRYKDDQPKLLTDASMFQSPEKKRGVWEGS